MGVGDKTLFDYAEDFSRKLEEHELEEATVNISFHYDDSSPVVDLFAELGDRGYVDSYELDISIEEFEESIYEAWIEAFEDKFESVFHD